MEGNFMRNRYIGVVLTYIILFFSRDLFEPSLMRLFEMEKEEAFTYSAMICYTIAFITILLLMQPEITRDSFKIPIGKFLKWTILGFLSLLVLQLLVNLFNVFVLGIDLASESGKQANMKNTFALFPISIISAALYAPIMEEILMRKILFKSLIRPTNVFVAAILSSFIFGALHGDFVFILNYTISGACLAFLYHKTNKLIVPITVHLMNNSFGVLGTFL